MAKYKKRLGPFWQPPVSEAINCRCVFVPVDPIPLPAWMFQDFPSHEKKTLRELYMATIQPTAHRVMRKTEQGERAFYRPALRHLDTLVILDDLEERQFFETAEHAAATALKDDLDGCIKLFKQAARDRSKPARKRRAED